MADGVIIDATNYNDILNKALKVKYDTNAEARRSRLDAQKRYNDKRYADPVYREQHNAKCGERIKKKYHEDPEYREKVLARQRVKYKENKERMKILEELAEKFKI